MFRFFTMLIFFLFLDLLTKRYFEAHYDIGETKIVLPQWLSWNLIHNPGASFGFLSGFTVLLIFIQLAAIILIFIVYFTIKKKRRFTSLGFALLLGGALGNFIDRIQYGYVIDFISFRWWPAIFNIADIEIRTGSIILIFYYIIVKNRGKTSKYNC
jgi:signal peptidase II